MENYDLESMLECMMDKPDAMIDGQFYENIGKIALCQSLFLNEEGAGKLLQACYACYLPDNPKADNQYEMEEVTEYPFINTGEVLSHGKSKPTEYIGERMEYSNFLEKHGIGGKLEEDLNKLMAELRLMSAISPSDLDAYSHLYREGVFADFKNGLTRH